MKINIEAPLRRYGGKIINLNEIAYVEARDPSGASLVKMKDGKEFSIPNAVINCWFEDLQDYYMLSKTPGYLGAKGVS